MSHCANVNKTMEKPEPSKPPEAAVGSMPWVGAEIELRTESDETVVASCALPISITALCAMEKGLRSQYGSGLFMRQRGTILEFFKPSSADETALEAEWAGTEPTDGDQRLRRGEERAP